MFSIRRLIGLSSVLFVLSACGGGGSSGDSGGQSPPPTTPTHTVATSATGSGSGSISPTSRTVSQGSTTSFTITAASGSTIASVSGCGGSLSGSTYTTALVTAACTVTAEFTVDDNLIQLAPPVVEGALLPGTVADLSPEFSYSGDGFLHFELLESPPGMTVNPRNGNIRWTPADEHAGQIFNVRLLATDGDTSSSLAFSVRVAQPTLLTTHSEVLADGRTRVTVTDPGLALNGLVVVLPHDFTASAYVTSVRDGTPGVALIDPSDAPSAGYLSPEIAIPLTEFFRIDPVSAETDFIEVLLPPLELPAGRHPEELVLYVYGQPNAIPGFRAPVWIPVTHALRVTEDDRALVLIAATGQLSFIGLNPVTTIGVNSPSAVFDYPLVTPVAGSATVPIQCSRDALFADVQLCEVEFPQTNGAQSMCPLDGLTDCTAQIRIRGFSGNAWTDEPVEFSVHHVAGWAADALIKFDTFKLPFDSWGSLHDVNIEVRVEDMPCDWGGYVFQDEGFRVLHLNSVSRCATPFTTEFMKSVLVHEYFHHAQSREGELLAEPASDRQWLSEATPVWFQDEVYDEHDFYLSFGLPSFLDRGLAFPTEPVDFVGYDRSTFFKLLQRSSTTVGLDAHGCDFEAVNSSGRAFLGEIFRGDSEVQSRASRLVDAVNNQSFNCNFGSTFGVLNRMANALEYYTYATQIRRDIRLLDRNEPVGSPARWWRTVGVEGETVAPTLRVVNLAPLSSIVIRLNDHQSESPQRLLQFQTLQAGTQAFVSLRTSIDAEGVNQAVLVTNDVMQMVGFERWEGWFLTLVNENPDQATTVTFTAFVEELSPQVSVEQLNSESCSGYGVCGVDFVFGPSIDFSQTHLEIDWGDNSSLSLVSVEACLASGDCQDMGDGRVRVWKAYAAPAAYGASIRYALWDGIWRDVGVGFSVSEVNSLSLSANPGDGAATLVWQDLGADRYNLCQANEPVDVFDTCSVYSGGVFALSVGSPPWLVSGLTNGSTYHFRLEALFGNERLISSAASAIPEAGGPGPVAPQALNDTGIELCANASTNWAVCPVAINPGQDGDFGRDALARAGQLEKVGSGAAGFDFTKLDANGNPLPASATSWQCVRDNHTGLIWEVKTADGGLRDRNNTYTWYNPDSSVNGGNAGTQSGGNCVGSACDTRAYSVAVNAQGLCGASDWRVPNIMELRSIIHLGAPRPLSLSSPVIDLSFFPNTIGVRFTQAGAGRYWSSSPWAGSFVWGVDFHHFDGTAAQGSDFGRSRDNPQRVRLVRGGTTDTADLADASCSTTSVPSTTPSEDFEVIAPGIVRHRSTGLEWQRCALGSSWDEAATSCTGTAITRPWSGSLLSADAEAGWRLPNINELNSIVERCNLSPAINGAVFPNTPSIWFWSSSPAPQNGARWGANFNNGGFVGMGGDSTFGGIRLVRGDSRFAGRWIGVATAGTSAYDYQWDLDQNGTDVTGTIRIADPNGPNMALYRMRGTINGDSMTFEGTSFIEYSNSSTFCMASGSVTLGGAADNIELTGVWGPLAIPGGCPVGSSGGIQLRKVL